MLKKTIAILLLVSLFACSKDDKNSGSLPGELKEITENNLNCVCEPYVDLYIWNGEKVYFLGYSGPACNWFPTWYDKNGIRIIMSQTFTFDQFKTEAKKISRVWECTGS